MSGSFLLAAQAVARLREMEQGRVCDGRAVFVAACLLLVLCVCAGVVLYYYVRPPWKEVEKRRMKWIAKRLARHLCLPVKKKHVARVEFEKGGFTATVVFNGAEYRVRMDDELEVLSEDEMD